MTSKRQTYPEQIQDLKEQLQQKDELIAKFEGGDNVIAGLKAQIADLEARLQAGIKADHHNAVSGKSQLTDAVQRAESAEQGIRNLQNRNRDLEQLKESLEAQINVLAMEVDKTIGKDKKLIAFEEVVKTQNLQILQLQQRITDIATEKDAQISELERNARDWKALTQHKDKELSDLLDHIQEFNLLKHLGR